MSLSEKVQKLSAEIEALEEQLQDYEDLKQANLELENENDYLRSLLRGFGIADVWGDYNIKSLSVADVMALEKAIEMAKVL